MNTFYNLSTQCHQDRLQQDYLNRLENPPHLTRIVADFFLYYGMNELPRNIETFEQFLTSENIKINQIEKNWIVKRLFGKLS